MKVPIHEPAEFACCSPKCEMKDGKCVTHEAKKCAKDCADACCKPPAKAEPPKADHPRGEHPKGRLPRNVVEFRVEAFRASAMTWMFVWRRR